MAADLALLDDFMQRTGEEDPRLARALSKLPADARPALAAVLSRFDAAGAGVLDEDERALARQVVGRLHRPTARGLELLGAVLAFLAVDRGEEPALSREESRLAVEILELFCKADSVNDTLSQKELEMLLAVLEHLDADGNRRLDPDERTRLRDELWDASGFLEQQKRDNPRLRALLGR